MRCCSTASTRMRGACADSSMRSSSRSWLLSTTRNRDWTFGIALSRRVVFHSTALDRLRRLPALHGGGGVLRPLLRRRTGGARCRSRWCSPALLALGTMAFSGSIRAKLRVIVSKHFFSYRYDYRDEWLRFTQALSARGGAARARAGRHQGACRHAGESGRKPLASRCVRPEFRRRPPAGTCRPTRWPSPPTANSSAS